jgi:hypothetical protein
LIGVVLVTAIWLVRRHRSAFTSWRATRARAHAESEATRYAELRHACDTNDATEAYRALERWVRAAGVISLAALRRETPSLDAELGTLERHLFAAKYPLDGWNGAELAEAVRARRALRRRSKKQTVSVLPPLNPRFGRT